MMDGRGKQMQDLRREEYEGRVGCQFLGCLVLWVYPYIVW